MYSMEETVQPNTYWASSSSICRFGPICATPGMLFLALIGGIYGLQELPGTVILEYRHTVFLEEPEPGHEIVLLLWQWDVELFEDLIHD